MGSPGTDIRASDLRAGDVLGRDRIEWVGEPERIEPFSGTTGPRTVIPVQYADGTRDELDPGQWVNVTDRGPAHGVPLRVVGA